jgi:hypothetical protein
MFLLVELRMSIARIGPCARKQPTIPLYPCQEGTSLNAANINYTTLKAMQALKKLEGLEAIGHPGN